MRWLCIPKQPTATKSFFAIKLFLQVVFVACFIYQSFITVYYLKYYRDRVLDIKVSSVFPSRSEIQVETTHSHFFLFTGLLNGSAILVGLWGILMEYLVILVGYSYIHSVVIGFELIGCWQSYNLEVAQQKGLGILAEVPLVILGLIFAHLVREAERKLANDPLFKKKMAQKAGKGETMSDPDYVIPEKSKSAIKSGARMVGVDNVALDMTNEVIASDRRHNTPSSSGRSSMSSSYEDASAVAGGQPPRKTTLTTDGHDVTVMTSEGRTKINVPSESVVVSLNPNEETSTTEVDANKEVAEVSVTLEDE